MAEIVLFFCRDFVHLKFLISNDLSAGRESQALAQLKTLPTYSPVDMLNDADLSPWIWTTML
jgi:hypothetical protein